MSLLVIFDYGCFHTLVSSSEVCFQINKYILHGGLIRKCYTPAVCEIYMQRGVSTSLHSLIIFSKHCFRVGVMLAPEPVPGSLGKRWNRQWSGCQLSYYSFQGQISLNSIYTDLICLTLLSKETKRSCSGNQQLQIGGTGIHCMTVWSLAQCLNHQNIKIWFWICKNGRN